LNNGAESSSLHQGLIQACATRPIEQKYGLVMAAWACWPPPFTKSIWAGHGCDENQEAVCLGYGANNT